MRTIKWTREKIWHLFCFAMWQAAQTVLCMYAPLFIYGKFECFVNIFSCFCVLCIWKISFMITEHHHHHHHHKKKDGQIWTGYTCSIVSKDPKIQKIFCFAFLSLNRKKLYKFYKHKQQHLSCSPAWFESHDQWYLLSLVDNMKYFFDYNTIMFLYFTMFAILIFSYFHV